MDGDASLSPRQGKVSLPPRTQRRGLIFLDPASVQKGDSIAVYTMDSSESLTFAHSAEAFLDQLSSVLLRLHQLFLVTRSRIDLSSSSLNSSIVIPTAPFYKNKHLYSQCKFSFFLFLLEVYQLSLIFFKCLHIIFFKNQSK